MYSMKYLLYVPESYSTNHWTIAFCHVSDTSRRIHVHGRRLPLDIYRCYPYGYRLLYQWQSGNLRPCTWILRLVSETWQKAIVQWFVEYDSGTYNKYFIEYINRAAVYLHPWWWLYSQFRICNDSRCCNRYIIFSVRCISYRIYDDEEQKDCWACCWSSKIRTI